MIFYARRTPGECINAAVNDGRTTAASFGKWMGWWVLGVRA